MEILRIRFDQDLCKNINMTKKSYFGKQNSTLGSVVPFAMFVFIRDVVIEKMAILGS